MYAICLVCSDPLGTNDVLETLPIGRRVAFDAATGRLWVVCPSCARWNLVPFDTRLETIDACERLFRDTRVRYSTGTIGLARLREGLELVRIGAALRPEFAAWRYGQRLGRRRRKAPSPPVGGSTGIFAGLDRGMQMVQWLLALPFLDAGVRPRHALRNERLIRDPSTGYLLRVPEVALVQSVLSREGEGWRLEIPYRSHLEYVLGVDPLAIASFRDHPSVGFFRGNELHQALGRVLPTFEDRVPGQAVVQEATRLIERNLENPAGLFAYVAGRPLRFETRSEFPLREVGPEVRLALEMMAHEETEREALAGELKLLEREWREADRLAKIVDDMTLDGEQREGSGD
jgi:hypothetical protein